MHKRPSLAGFQLDQVGLNLSVGAAFGEARRRIAYERLLLDVLQGNSALFVRRDEIDAAWQWIDGIVEGWRRTGQQPAALRGGQLGAGRGNAHHQVRSVRARAQGPAPRP
jgi:glucose-6-phosphate 1-dehydrogenase